MRRELELSEKTIVDWRHFCREVCEVIFVEERGLIGGEGLTVEKDESKFGKENIISGGGQMENQNTTEPQAKQSRYTAPEPNTSNNSLDDFAL